MIRRFVNDLRARFGVRAYSQEGEDLILARYFENTATGFFVDVGAHHPFRFSNTYLLYRRGWRGVNIDALPGSMRLFQRHRPRDLNIEAAIGTTSSSATYFMFNEPALNTFDRDVALDRQGGPWRVVGEVSIPIRPLKDVLASMVPPNQKIDLLTVDVEGRDLDVLSSNDWTRFRPTVVLAETLGHGFASCVAEPAAVYLEGLGYELVAKTFYTMFFRDRASASQ